MSKTCVSVFRYSIQHDKASGYTFYQQEQILL